MDFLSSQSKKEKPIDNVRVILNKIHLSLFTASYVVFSPHLLLAFDYLGSSYWKNKLMSVFLYVCLLIDDKFHHNIVKVYCGTTFNICVFTGKL